MFTNSLLFAAWDVFFWLFFGRLYAQTRISLFMEQPKTLSILNQILKESYRSGLKVWNFLNITRMISLHLDQTPVGKNIWWII